MKVTIPTAVTLFRIGLIPLFVIVFYLPFPWSDLAAAAIFAFASLTDWVDGYLARVLKQESSFGAFLDPVADKLMVVVAIVLIVESHPSIYIAIPSVIIIAREISVSALREWMASVGAQGQVAVSWTGKVKTGFQMFGIAFMVYQSKIFGLDIYVLGYWLLVIASVMTLWSMYIYLKAAWPTLNAAD